MKKIKQQTPFTLMRKLGLNGFLAILVMAFGMSACSDDDNDDAGSAFPEKQTLNCKDGDTAEFTFQVNTNWQLTSSATWCRFVTDEVEDYSLSGIAGKQTVKLKITDEALEFDAPTTAQLIMMIGADKAIVADVVRSSKNRSLKIYDMEGNEIEKIEVGYDEYLPFVVQANFRFAATNRPEWLDIEGNAIVGSINKKVTGNVKMIGDPQYAKYVQNGELTFTDEQGIESYTFPLVYKGMNPNVIEVINSNPWNWEVSLDGKTFIQTSSSGASATTATSTYRNFVPFTIQAFDDDFEPVYIEKRSEYGMTRMLISGEDDVDWMHLTGEKGNMRLKIDEASEEREGFVLVIPRALYNEIKDDLWGNLIEMDIETGEPDIKSSYQQSNLVMNVVQKQKKQVDEQAFKVTYYDADWVPQEVDCTKVTDPDIIAQYSGVSDIYTMEWPSANSFTVDPMEGNFETDWLFKVMRGDKDITSEGIAEGSDTTSNLYLEDPSTMTEALHFLIMKDDEIKKVLIITPNHN